VRAKQNGSSGPTNHISHAFFELVEVSPELKEYAEGLWDSA